MELKLHAVSEEEAIRRFKETHKSVSVQRAVDGTIILEGRRACINCGKHHLATSEARKRCDHIILGTIRQCYAMELDKKGHKVIEDE